MSESPLTLACPSCYATYSADTLECPADGNALVDAELVARSRPLPTGTMVGEYRVEELMGEGTFGHVYRGVHPIIGRQAAIKVLKPAFSSDPEMLARFIEEARAANRIRHRGIIDVFGFGALPDGRHYYVMEYLKGITLDRYMATHPSLGLSEALPILRGIARAIDAAHASGVVHRDLKPANVFMCLEEDQNPRPKVLDFGIAKLLSADTGTNTRAGTPLGTPQYMSPEQSRGLPVTKSTDVYAFGVMVFELLTGKMPFNGETAMDVLIQHINAPPPRPSDVNPKLPPTLNAPILQMLAKDPVARPASLTVAVEDLAQATGHTWSLVAPRNSSHAELAAVSLKPMHSDFEGFDPSATQSLQRVPNTIEPTTTVPPSFGDAPKKTNIWLAVAVAIVALVAAAIVPGLWSKPEAPTVTSAVGPPIAPPPATSNVTAAATATAESPAPIESAQVAAPEPQPKPAKGARRPAAESGAQKSPTSAPKRSPKDIEDNPY